MPANTYKPYKELIFFHLISAKSSATENIISGNASFAFKPNIPVLQIHFLSLLKKAHVNLVTIHLPPRTHLSLTLYIRSLPAL